MTARYLSRGMLRIGRLALAGVLLVLLWQVADGPAAARLLAAADPAWLAAAAAALTAQTLLSALRWRLVAAQLGIRLGLREAVAEYYLSQAVNQALPGGMAGDAGRAFRSRGEAGLLASGQAVVFERLAGQVAMFAVLAVAF
ncbi:MAG: flippase-like domain-containing protein, partial [Rhodobacteraceae bacterium]|nr:flippase-like domain-containing protein [Paracoccaceae bacterium]